MINKKLLSGIICVIFLLSTLSVAALPFSDVENDPTVQWAKPYINEMAELGYIKGYEDGTFKPNNTISKTEALILLSRMIGVNDESFADSLEYAVSEYKDTLSKFSTNYAKEVSFLLYVGILDADDLGTYISNANKNTALKRYEAAVLLTKLLGAEEEVLGNAFVSSSYADTVEIPDSARAYVEYVKEKGIMQGMGNNEQGQPMFSPNTSVTRSQMAKMLYSLIDVIDLSSQTGTVVSVDTFNETITVTIGGSDLVYNIKANTKFKVNGKDVKSTDLRKGMSVKVTHIAGDVALIENNVVIEDSVIYGLVSTTKDSTTRSVTIADANNKKNVSTYVLADNAKIRVNGAIDLFSKVKANNYVALTLVDGLVETLEVIDKTTTASGTLVSIDASGEFTVLNVEDKSGEVGAYEISADGVDVSRNSLSSNLNQLMTGDTVVLKMTYGKVTKISASSKNHNLSGSISYITHSKDGSVIGLETSNSLTEYKVNKSVSVLIDSTEEGTVYDLRPGTDIDITLQSSEIITIKAASVVAKSSLNGTVKSINATYGLMVVEESGIDYNVFVNSSTKIIDSASGRNILLKNVEKGKFVTVTGSNASGVLEASVIVIQ